MDSEDAVLHQAHQRRVLRIVASTPSTRPDEHWYISTACYHMEHGLCRMTCKYCEASCQCECHVDK